MASPVYIDDDYVAAFITAQRRDSLVASAASRLIIYEAATSTVRKIIRGRGITPPTTAELATLEIDGPFIRTVTLGEALPVLFGSKGQEVPRQFLSSVHQRNSFVRGDLHLEELVAKAQDAIGGIVVESASTVDNDPDPTFGDLQHDF